MKEQEKIADVFCYKIEIKNNILKIWITYDNLVLNSSIINNWNWIFYRKTNQEDQIEYVTGPWIKISKNIETNLLSKDIKFVFEQIDYILLKYNLNNEKISFKDAFEKEYKTEILETESNLFESFDDDKESIWLFFIFDWSYSAAKEVSTKHNLNLDKIIEKYSYSLFQFFISFFYSNELPFKLLISLIFSKEEPLEKLMEDVYFKNFYNFFKPFFQKVFFWVFNKSSFSEDEILFLWPCIKEIFSYINLDKSPKFIGLFEAQKFFHWKSYKFTIEYEKKMKLFGLLKIWQQNDVNYKVVWNEDLMSYLKTTWKPLFVETKSFKEMETFLSIVEKTLKFWNIKKIENIKKDFFSFKNKFPKGFVKLDIVKWSTFKTLSPEDKKEMSIDTLMVDYVANNKEFDKIFLKNRDNEYVIQHFVNSKLYSVTYLNTNVQSLHSTWKDVYDNLVKHRWLDGWKIIELFNWKEEKNLVYSTEDFKILLDNSEFIDCKIKFDDGTLLEIDAITKLKNKKISIKSNWIESYMSSREIINLINKLYDTK